MSEGSQSTPPATPPSNSDEWADQPINLTLLVELCEGHMRAEGLMDPTSTADGGLERELQHLSQLISCGDIAAALQLLERIAPDVCHHQPLLFEMKKQQFIELARGGHVDAALAFARDELAPRALHAFPDAYVSFKEAMLAAVFPPHLFAPHAASGAASAGATAAVGAMPTVRRRGGSSPADLPPPLLLSGAGGGLGGLTPASPSPPSPVPVPVPVPMSVPPTGARATVQSCVEELWSDERRQRLADSVEARVRLSTHCFGTPLALMLKYAGLVSKKWLSVRRDWEVKKVFKLVGERKALVDTISDDPMGTPMAALDEAHVQALTQALSILRDSSVAALRRARGDVHEALLGELQRVALNAALLRTQVQELLAAQGVAGAVLPDGPRRTAYAHLQRVRALLTSGDVCACIALLARECPQLARNHKHVAFYLHAAHFLRLCESGADAEAIAVAQGTLGPLAAEERSLLPALKVVMRQLVAWLPADAADEEAAAEHLAPARLDALVAPVCAAAASELGVPEPALLPMLRMMLWGHTKWFQFQQCRDIFAARVHIAALKQPDFGAASKAGTPTLATAAEAWGAMAGAGGMDMPPSIDDELSLLLGSSFRLTAGGARGGGASALGATLGAPRVGVRQMRAQTLAAPPLRPLAVEPLEPLPLAMDESAIITVMEFLAVSRADAISMLEESDGSVQDVIEGYLG